MDYIELNCKIEHNSEEARDILVAELSYLGYETFQESEFGISAYISKDQYEEKVYEEIYCVKNMIFGKVQFDHVLFKEKNWNEYWEKNFQPVIIDDKLLIKAPFHEIQEKYEYVIVLEPKMSFGTGHHPTTRVMLSAMIEMDLSEKDILDIGCGTGILSIFAGLKSANRIIGIDNNDWAYRNALENIQLNNVPDVTINEGDIHSVELNQKYDVILANINRNVILQEMSSFLNFLKPGGSILFSGILKENFPEVHEEAMKNNLLLIERQEFKDWLMLKYAFNSAPQN